MKVKFVEVVDDLNCGYIPFIIMEVEEHDELLVENRFSPGYRFIVQAMYHQVGAAGGYSFNPYEEDRVRNISKKIDSTEADVLGFYLSNINDIYSIPNKLFTKNFWGVVRTDGYGKYKEIEDEYDTNEDKCYKVLLDLEPMCLDDSIIKMKTMLEDHQNRKRNSAGNYNDLLKDIGINTEDMLKDTLSFLETETEKELAKGIDVKKHTASSRIELALVDKTTLKEIAREECGKEHIIAKYLWLPHDELPKHLWEEVKEKNEEYSIKCIYDL